MNTHIHSKQVLLRLSKIEGHVRGIKNMVENGKECEEVLIQISAVQAALKSLNVVILTDHLDHCVVKGIEDGHAPEVLDTFTRALKHVLK